MDLRLEPQLLQLAARVRHLAEERLAPRARRSDEEGIFDRDLAPQLGAAGLLDDRLSAQATALIAEELGRVDSSVRGFVTVQAGLVGHCLADWGTEAQKEAWLHRLRAGEAIGCYALTEPEAGTDARSITTRATRTDDGWRLKGEKHWITNGGVADVGLVFARADEGLSAFVVPTSTPGFERTPMAGRELGHRGSDHAFLRLQVALPVDALLGELGQGFKVAMSALGHGRLGVAAGAVGVLQACLEATVDFARRRRQFGQRIGDFGMIQAALADMATDLAAGRLLVRQAAWLRDAGEDNAQAVAMAKLFCTEAALRGADQAILIHGARGYSNEYAVERYWRDAKGMQIYEGTAHVQRVILARQLLGRDEGGASVG